MILVVMTKTLPFTEQGLKNNLLFTFFNHHPNSGVGVAYRIEFRYMFAYNSTNVNHLFVWLFGHKKGFIV